MSSVMLAADSAAIQDRGASLLRRAQGVLAGLLFLAVRVPIYVGVLLLGALVSLIGVVLHVIQAVGLRLTRPAGAAAASVLALVCIASPQRAKADTVSDTLLMQQTTPVTGLQQSNLYAFDAPGAGTLSITLKDWGFPVPMQQLTAYVASQDETWNLVSSQNSQWLLDLPISSGGVFDAFVAAEAGTFDGMQLGVYSMSVDFQPAASPVPLPPALDLLLGGMGLLGAVTLVERLSRRRNGDVISIA